MNSRRPPPTKLFEKPRGQSYLPPEKPKPLPLRLLQEGHEDDVCDKCGSSVKRTLFGLGRVRGCIQPECSNYYYDPGTSSSGPR